MARAVLLVVLGFAATAFAHAESSSIHGYDPSATTYTGPMFNPSNALNFGPASTHSTITSTSTHCSGSSKQTTHTTLASIPATSKPSSPASTNNSPTTIPSITSSAGATSTSPSVAQVSIAAAQANYAGFMGSLAGGVIAGLVFV